MISVAQGFLKSWGMILVSEIGDKTFFIAAVMAMKNPRTTVCHTLFNRARCLAHQTLRTSSADRRAAQVFAGALGALAAMTILSAAMGWAAPNLVRGGLLHSCTLSAGRQRGACG